MIMPNATTSTSYGQNESHSIGGTWGSAKEVMEFNREMMKDQQKFNAEEAQKNRDWQQTMSNTAYQRAMEDMQKAGLNPILAYQQGGASTGSGATAASSMASGMTDTYNQSDSWGMNSAASYSNWAEQIAALGNGFASIIGTLFNMPGLKATDIIQSIGEEATSAVKQATRAISNTKAGQMKYGGHALGSLAESWWNSLPTHGKGAGRHTK